MNAIRRTSGAFLAKASKSANLLMRGRRWRRGSTATGTDMSTVSQTEYGADSDDEDDEDDEDDDGLTTEASRTVSQGLEVTSPKVDDTPELDAPSKGGTLLQKRRASEEASIPGATDDQQHLDWDDELTEDDFEALEAVLQSMQPKCRPPASLVVDTDLQAAIKSRLHPSRHCNAVLQFGSTGPRSEFGANFTESQARSVPRVIIISGHNGTGGNIAVNGIYERYPADYHGRAVFQKVLEKRVLGHNLHNQDPEAQVAWAPMKDFMLQREDQVQIGAAGLAVARATLAGAGHDLDSQEVCMLSRSRYKCTTLPKPPPPPKDSAAILVGDKHANQWFLFFDRLHGWWCIGPRPGAKQIVARCAGSEELVPDRLRNWEVWDAGNCAWRRHQRICAMKGGH